MPKTLSPNAGTGILSVWNDIAPDVEDRYKLHRRFDRHDRCFQIRRLRAGVGAFFGARAQVIEVAAQAEAIGGARGFVADPGGLPGGEEGAAGLAQRRPIGIVAQFRRAQIDALAVDAA